MRDVCDSLVNQGDLNEVREGEGEPDLELDPIVGYWASAQLHEARAAAGGPKTDGRLVG